MNLCVAGQNRILVVRQDCVALRDGFVRDVVGELLELRMNRYGEQDFLTVGLRALAVLADNAPLDVAGFAKLNSLPEEAARGLIHTFVTSGYARQMDDPELYVLTSLARSLIGLAGPGDLLN